MIEKILRMMQEGGTIDSIAEKLDMRKATIRAILESMVDKGYLMEVNCGSHCNGCSLTCSKSTPTDAKMKMYTVTEKGVKQIRVHTG